MQAQATTTGSKQWHADRRLGIGGSDAAAALGLSKFRTPYQLYLEKTGQGEEQDEVWEMQRGKAMEPLLRQHYADTTGRSVMTRSTAIVCEKYPFMRYNPDGLTDDGRLVEFKTAAYGDGWGEVGSDEIPQEYILQVQHGMIVTGREITDCSVSIAGNKPKYFVVEADHGLQEMIIEGEAKFWELVKSETPPEPITNDDVAKMYSRVNGQSIIATPAISTALTQLRITKEAMKQAEIDKEAFEVLIKNYMGANEVLVDEGMTTLATWKQQAGAKRVDADALRTNFPDIAMQVTKQGAASRRFLLK